MTLTPRFDIMPHGIITRHNKEFAVFKMAISFNEFNNPNGEQLTYEDWKLAAATIDGTSWFYKLEPSGGGRMLFIGKSMAAGFTPFQFYLKGKNPNEVRFEQAFHLGKRLVNQEIKDSFEFLKQRGVKFFLPKKQNAAAQKVNVVQFDRMAGVTASVADRDDVYSDILRQARVHADYNRGRTRRKGGTDAGYSFIAIYGSMMDEPTIAEIQFGLVREFHIEVTQFPEADGKYEYLIQVENEGVSDSPFLFERKTIEGSPRYYNGLKKRFFQPSDFEVDQPASGVNPTTYKVRYSFVDTYREALEKQKLIPDGIYISATYKQSQNGIEDPFALPGIKGFNAVMRDEAGKTVSLSLHNKRLKLNGGDSYQLERESGCLNARSEIQTGAVNVRNNLLIAWRGDNLLVNRIAPQQEAEQPDVTEHNTGHASSEQQFCREDEFVRKNLFKVEESLVASSQVYLLAQKKYEFFLRTVSPTHHYLPTRAELSSAQSPRTLTLEDLTVDIISILPPIHFNVGRADSIPIAAPTIIGKHTYENANTDLVDHHTHLVLNKIKKETIETRYVYPPRIKMEDLKIFGFLAKSALTKNGEPVVSLETYVNRCMELEKKLEAPHLKVYPGKIPIAYLGDLRATKLFILPADLFTASHTNPRSIDAFAYILKYPFYNGVYCTEVRASGNNAVNQIIFTGQNSASNQIFPNLPDGIYHFDVYTIDADFTGNNLADQLVRYNSTAVRISLLNSPPGPQLTKRPNFELQRFSSKETKPNYWFMPITVPAESTVWKSLKYLEETTVLKLQHETADNALKQFYPSGNVPELMRKEYPYEIFLTSEGSITEKRGLQTNIYPDQLLLEYSIPSSLDGSGIFFQLRLNDEEMLEARYDKENGHLLRFGYLQVAGDKFKIEIKFKPEENSYYLWKDGTEWQKMNKYINPDISLADVNMPKEILPYIQLDVSGKFNFQRTNHYTFIADLGTPYYRDKKIRLFASSIFQAYFPKAKTEFEIGAFGARYNDIKIPNNTVPDPPIIEADVLLRRQRNISWNDLGSADIKDDVTDSLVRITMQQDFMKEGKNKLALVVAKPGEKPKEKNPNVSRIGEDITKLTPTDWSLSGIKDLLDLSGSDPLFKKYFESSASSYYMVDGVTYEVLSLTPFYNTELRKWQVVLPFKFFRASEVMFLKFICFKIAPGHGMRLQASGKINSPTNPFIDYTGTNFSGFSKGVQLPVYTRKMIRISRTRTAGRNTYTIKVNSLSSYENKIYFLMMPKVRLDRNPLNLRKVSDNDLFPDLATFSLNPHQAGASQGKVLAFKSYEEVIVSRENANAVFVLECEIHSNAVDVPAHKSFDVKQNPFFEIKGVRPINLSEFTI